MLKNLWLYRYFIVASIRADLKGRFARSYLGGLWFLLHPLAQALIFSIVLSEVMHARMPASDNNAAYPIYLLAGMAAWGLFSEIINRSMTIFIENAGVMKKISFPRLCLPVIVLGSALINHALLLAAMIVIFAFFGHYPGLAWLYVIPAMMLIAAFGFGIGVFLGIINVFVRDVSQVMSVALQLWFWFTPIVYVKEVIPERFRELIAFNPMLGPVEVYHNALLLDQGVDFVTVLPAIVISAIAVVASFALFRRASPELVDAL